MYAFWARAASPPPARGAAPFGAAAAVLLPSLTGRGVAGQTYTHPLHIPGGSPNGQYTVDDGTNGARSYYRVFQQ